MCPGYVGRDLGSDGKLLDVQCLSRARRHLQLARRMCEIAGPRMRCLLFSQGPKCLAISTLFASVQRLVRETQYEVKDVAADRSGVSADVSNFDQQVFASSSSMVTPSE